MTEAWNEATIARVNAMKRHADAQQKLKAIDQFRKKLTRKPALALTNEFMSGRKQVACGSSIHVVGNAQMAGWFAALDKVREIYHNLRSRGIDEPSLNALGLEMQAIPDAIEGGKFLQSVSVISTIQKSMMLQHSFAQIVVAFNIAAVEMIDSQEQQALAALRRNDDWVLQTLKNLKD